MISVFVVRDLNLAAFTQWNAGIYPFIFGRLLMFVGIIASSNSMYPAAGSSLRHACARIELL
jgi:hypothetical protein